MQTRDSFKNHRRQQETWEIHSGSLGMTLARNSTRGQGSRKRK